MEYETVECCVLVDILDHLPAAFPDSLTVYGLCIGSFFPSPQLPYEFRNNNTGNVACCMINEVQELNIILNIFHLDIKKTLELLYDIVKVKQGRKMNSLHVATIKMSLKYF